MKGYSAFCDSFGPGKVRQTCLVLIAGQVQVSCIRVLQEGRPVRQNLEALYIFRAEQVTVTLAKRHKSRVLVDSSEASMRQSRAHHQLIGWLWTAICFKQPVSTVSLVCELQCHVQRDGGLDIPVSHQHCKKSCIARSEFQVRVCEASCMHCTS